MRINLDSSSIADYERFLAVKSMPTFRFKGRTAIFPDEYANMLGVTRSEQRHVDYQPWPGLFDYQRDIAAMAIAKRRFSVFADCGLGKTLILLEFARHVSSVIPDGQCVLIVSPLMVVRQTMAEAATWYGDALPIEQVPANKLHDWLINGKGKVGITNYDALTDDLVQGRLAGLILDESSMLKSHYGKWGQTCLRLGRGLHWKMALTGTPAPNDRIEYANHAVFMGAFPTINAFLARYFVNRGQTDNRWELKPHALRPFYMSLSHWAIFLTNPATYGWRDNCESIPPINVHIHDVPMTYQQRDAMHTETGTLIATSAGGITSRSTMARIAKGYHDGERIETHKPPFIRKLVDSWPDESTIIWCIYNDEQDQIAAQFPDAASIDGKTSYEDRERLINDFKARRRKVIISKPKILGFGLNLQVATRQVFSGLQDSYESYYQAVKRSNRYGSTKPLNVHIPITDIERPMIETVLEKAARVQSDTEEQERIFKEHRHVVA